MQDDEPVFEEPWQAQVFAMTVKLHERGVFSWQEWADALSAELKLQEDTGKQYYHHWLRALEKMAFEKGITEPQALIQREHEWHLAAARTPHGDPIEL